MIKTTLFINGLPIVYLVESGRESFLFTPEDEIWQCVYPAFSVTRQNGRWNFDQVDPFELTEQVAEEIALFENSQEERSNS